MEFTISEFMYDQTVQLQEYLITTISKGHNPYMQMMFESRRKNLFNSAVPKNLLPEWLSDIHSLSSFYQWIKEKGNVEQRKAFVCDSFKPALKYLQSKPSVIGQASVTDKLEVFRETYIHDSWMKALGRIENDPDGALTSARTLIETTCKFILKKLLIPFEDNVDLPKLCKLSVGALNVSPDPETKDAFTRIFSGCYTVIEGIGELRNKLSDSHGKDEDFKKPLRRHAELTVNLSGTLSVFMLETLESQSND
jgi:hypothetical protein